MKHFPTFLLSFVILFVLSSCQTDAPKSPEEFAKNLQRQLIEAKEGSVINIPEGKYEFKRPLSFNDVPNVTIKGAGKEKTILSFKNQVEGGEGVLVKSATGVTLEGFTVVDTKGDAIKVQDCTDVIMRDLGATWTTGKVSTNGGYGLYPVSCTNVLMENCEASYAMDAGIYVGQSTRAIVRNNYAHNNVAGIEIENTIDADVYENKSVDNAGGMMIFDMPDLPQVNGSNIRVHNNVVKNNNGENFSTPGIAVSMLPPGTGFLIMAHRDIEIYDNIISDHNTVSIAISSWLFTGRPFQSKEYDPFVHDVNIFNNKIDLGSSASDMSTDFGKVLSLVSGGKALGVAVDGIFNPEHLDKKGNLKNGFQICLKDNGDLPFVNLNAAKALDENGVNPEKLAAVVSMDMTAFTCQ